MTRSEDSKIIKIVHPICCGLDVHKESISACVLYIDVNGVDRHEIKVFGTFTGDLMGKDWGQVFDLDFSAIRSSIL